jgi:SOS response associated peptidase (SRAP)
MMRWGIVPCFAKSEAEFKALSTVNAKSDRLTDSKMWREPFAKRRCLVPASGLYEWPKHNKINKEFLVSEVPEASAESGDLFDREEFPAGSADLFPIEPVPAPAAHRSGKPLNRVVRAKPVKRVFNITLADQGVTPFAFAGIWDAWKRPDGTYLETFALVTTEPNSSSRRSTIVSRSSCTPETTTAGWVSTPLAAIRACPSTCSILSTPTRW